MAKILLIESDILLARSYSSILERKGHDLTIVSDAQSAIDACDVNKPDLIFLELQLANHNGLEFLYEFRSYPEWQKLPIIILSMIPPSEFSSNPVLWKDLAISDYLYKPHISLKRIISVVEDLVTTTA